MNRSKLYFTPQIVSLLYFTIDACSDIFEPNPKHNKTIYTLEKVEKVKQYMRFIKPVFIGDHSGSSTQNPNKRSRGGNVFNLQLKYFTKFFSVTAFNPGDNATEQWIAMTSQMKRIVQAASGKTSFAVKRPANACPGARNAIEKSIVETAQTNPDVPIGGLGKNS